MSNPKLLLREVAQDLRILIADGKQMSASARRNKEWCALATSEAYVNGLVLALDVVRRIQTREGTR